MPELADHLRRAVDTLLGELLDGPPSSGAGVLNPGDRGLLASLDVLSADAASVSRGGRSSIAAHVDHLCYGFTLLNRWARGERDPWADAEYARSWERQTVTDDEWRALCAALAREARSWMAAVSGPGDWDESNVSLALSSVVHLAYHVGAIRQIDCAASGPRASD